MCTSFFLLTRVTDNSSTFVIASQARETILIELYERVFETENHDRVACYRKMLTPTRQRRRNLRS